MRGRRLHRSPTAIVRAFYLALSMIAPSVAAMGFIVYANRDLVECQQAIDSFKSDYYIFPKEP